MDYPDTDEANFAKDAKDLNEYCSFHEMHFQDFDRQGMMTELQDRIEKPDYMKEGKSKIIENKEIQQDSNMPADNKHIYKLTVISNTSDSRETSSGFI
jgi:hypothetical protein